MWRKGCGISALVLCAFAAGYAIAQTTGRISQFENEEVKVWKSTIMPNAPLPLHRHEHPRVLIALSGGTMNIQDEGGKPDTHVWESGHAYWLPANAPGTMHQDINVGDTPIEVIVVELQKAR